MQWKTYVVYPITVVPLDVVLPVLG